MKNTYPKNFEKLFVMVLACASSQAAADETLTWEACVSEAAARNAALIAAKETVERAESQVSSGYSPFLPQLTGSVGYTQSGSSTGAALVVTNPNGIATSSSGSQGQYSLGLNTTLNVFNGFQDRAKLDQAKASSRSAEAALRSQKATLHQDLKKAFAQLLYAQSALALSVEIEKRRKDNFDLVELRFEGGRENKGSYLRSKASYRQAQFDVAQGRRNLRVAQKQLARLLGRDLLVPISVRGELSAKPLAKDEPLFRDLANQTPSVAQSKYDSEGAQAATRRAYGAFSPSLSLNGSVSKIGNDFPPDTNRWTVGATLSIPIFQWTNFADVAAAKAEERRADVNVRNAEELSGARLEETFAALRNSVERVDVQAETVSAAAARSEIARSQYSSGLVSYNDWDIIENDLISQQQSLLSFKRDAVVAEANWEQALGKGDIP